ncbi:MAG: hypothetical protein ACF8LK_10500 [Phycisphaerales bacterium JB041]
MTTAKQHVLFAILTITLASAGAFGQFNTRPKKDTGDTPTRERDLERFRDEADEVLAPLTGAGQGNPASDTEAYWSIVLVAFTEIEPKPGERPLSAAERAEIGLAKVVNEAGLTGAFVEKRDKATVVAYGRYDGPDDPRAIADLERLRTLRVAGQTPFAAALLSPPDPSLLTGSLPELDLRNAKRLFGEDNALYTLQIGIYGRGDRSPATAAEIREFRKAAEQAAVLLRRDGELAFYYHAPERSMVTVGVFGQDDYDPRNRQGIESFELIQTRERHALNLLNGQGIRERIPGTKGEGASAFRLQPSKLVAVPEN